VVIGLDEGQNENSFCMFHDGSLIDNGSLFFYLKQKDKER
jgi:hypothetical protein